MIEYNSLLAAIKLRKIFPEHRSMVVSGVCQSCGKKIQSHPITVFPDQTAREAFDWYWYSLQTDCELTLKDTTDY